MTLGLAVSLTNPDLDRLAAHGKDFTAPYRYQTHEDTIAALIRALESSQPGIDYKTYALKLLTTLFHLQEIDTNVLGSNADSLAALGKRQQQHLKTIEKINKDIRKTNKSDVSADQMADRLTEQQRAVDQLRAICKKIHAGYIPEELLDAQRTILNKLQKLNADIQDVDNQIRTNTTGTISELNAQLTQLIEERKKVTAELEKVKARISAAKKNLVEEYESTTNILKQYNRSIFGLSANQESPEIIRNLETEFAALARVNQKILDASNKPYLPDILNELGIKLKNLDLRSLTDAQMKTLTDALALIATGGNQEYEKRLAEIIYLLLGNHSQKELHSGLLGILYLLSEHNLQIVPEDFPRNGFITHSPKHPKGKFVSVKATSGKTDSPRILTHIANYFRKNHQTTDEELAQIFYISSQRGLFGQVSDKLHLFFLEDHNQKIQAIADENIRREQISRQPVSKNEPPRFYFDKNNRLTKITCKFKIVLENTSRANGKSYEPTLAVGYFEYKLPKYLTPGKLLYGNLAKPDVKFVVYANRHYQSALDNWRNTIYPALGKITPELRQKIGTTTGAVISGGTSLGTLAVLTVLGLIPGPNPLLIIPASIIVAAGVTALGTWLGRRIARNTTPELKVDPNCDPIVLQPEPPVNKDEEHAAKKKSKKGKAKSKGFVLESIDTNRPLETDTPRLVAQRLAEAEHPRGEDEYYASSESEHSSSNSSGSSRSKNRMRSSSSSSQTSDSSPEEIVRPITAFNLLSVLSSGSRSTSPHSVTPTSGSPRDVTPLSASIDNAEIDPSRFLFLCQS